MEEVRVHLVEHHSQEELVEDRRAEGGIAAVGHAGFRRMEVGAFLEVAVRGDQRCRRMPEAALDPHQELVGQVGQSHHEIMLAALRQCLELAELEHKMSHMLQSLMEDQACQGAVDCPPCQGAAVPEVEGQTVDDWHSLAVAGQHSVEEDACTLEAELRMVVQDAHNQVAACHNIRDRPAGVRRDVVVACAIQAAPHKVMATGVEDQGVHDHIQVAAQQEANLPLVEVEHRLVVPVGALVADGPAQVVSQCLKVLL